MLVAGSRKVSFVLLVLLFVGVFQMLWMMTAVNSAADEEPHLLPPHASEPAHAAAHEGEGSAAAERAPSVEEQLALREVEARKREEMEERHRKAERARKWDNIMSRRADETHGTHADKRTGETVADARARLRRKRLRKREQREEEAMEEQWNAFDEGTEDDGFFVDAAVQEEAAAEEKAVAEAAAVEAEAEAEAEAKAKLRRARGGMGRLRERRRDTGGLPMLGKPGDTRRMQNLDPSLGVRVSSGAKVERTVLFTAENDADWIATLRTAPLVEVKAMWTEGGSLPLFVKLEGGRRAVLKVQTKHRSSWVNSEIAAFHLDRVLGFNRVPPCASRRIGATELFDVIRRDNPKTADKYLRALQKRLVTGSDGTIECSLTAFLARGVVYDAVPPALEAGHRGLEGWKEWVAEGIDEYLVTAGYRVTDVFPFLDMHVFDTLISNPDRYGPGNILHYFDKLVLIDNSYAFFRNAPTYTKRERRRHWSLLTKPEMRVCAFNVHTLQRLREYDAGRESLEIDMKASMQHEAVQPVLGAEHYEVLALRVQKLLAHVDECSRLYEIDFVELNAEDYRGVFGAGPKYEDPDAARAADRAANAWLGFVGDILAHEE